MSFLASRLLRKQLWYSPRVRLAFDEQEQRRVHPRRTRLRELKVHRTNCGIGLVANLAKADKYTRNCTAIVRQYNCRSHLSALQMGENVVGGDKAFKPKEGSGGICAYTQGPPRPVHYHFRRVK